MTNRKGTYKLGDGPKPFLSLDTSNLLPYLVVKGFRINIIGVIVGYIVLTLIVGGIGLALAVAGNQTVLIIAGLMVGLGFLAFFVGVLSFIIVIWTRVFKDVF